jgi:hypothetical protein
MAKGNCERIGMEMAIWPQDRDGRKVEKEVVFPTP